MRTEKSPLRIACSACSRSWLGSGLAAPLRLEAGRRAGDVAPESRSLMIFPPASQKAESAQGLGMRTPVNQKDQAGTRGCSKLEPAGLTRANKQSGRG